MTALAAFRMFPPSAAFRSHSSAAASVTCRWSISKPLACSTSWCSASEPLSDSAKASNATFSACRASTSSVVASSDVGRNGLTRQAIAPEATASSTSSACDGDISRITGHDGCAEIRLRP